MIVYPIRCQVNDSNAVYTTLYLANIRTRVQLANVCLVIVITVPQVTCLTTWHTEWCQLSTQGLRLLLAKYKPVVGMQHVLNWYTLTCVTFTDSRWEMDLSQHVYKCTAPTTWQVSKSDRSLPSKTVKVVQKLLGPLPSAQLLAHWSNTPVVGTVLWWCKVVWAAAWAANTAFQHGISDDISSRHFSMTPHCGTSAWRPIMALQHHAPSRQFSITLHHGNSASRSSTALQHHAPVQHFSITLQYSTSALPCSSLVTPTLMCSFLICG
jgi:hypothetical protein